MSRREPAGVRLVRLRRGQRGLSLTSPGGGRSREVLLLSHAGDRHTLEVGRRLTEDHDLAVRVVDTDDQVMAGRVAWTLGGSAHLYDREGHAIDPGEIGVIWNRRVRQPQRVPRGAFDAADEAFLTTEWRDALAGVLATRFTGRWVNDPAAVATAENKLHQLTVMVSLGLRVPRTFIGQDVLALRRFLDQLGGHRVAVKKVRGTRGSQTETLMRTVDELMAQPHAIRVSPAIYQEVVPGRDHLRLHVFGSDVVGVGIASDVFDWRTDPTLPMAPVEVPDDLATQAVALTRALGLRMAIVDVKVSADDGRPTWLEVNQQGQFLFAQTRSGVDLVGAMAEFLAAELRGESAEEPVAL